MSNFSYAIKIVPASGLRNEHRVTVSYPLVPASYDILSGPDGYAASGVRVWQDVEFDSLDTITSQPYLPSGGMLVYFDAALGITADSSDNVTQWKDLSDNNYHAVQSDTAKAPKYIANERNSAVRSTSVSQQHMNLASGVLFDSRSQSLFIVTQLHNNYNGVMAFGAGSGLSYAGSLWYAGKVLTVYDGSNKSTSWRANAGPSLIGYVSSASTCYVHFNNKTQDLGLLTQRNFNGGYIGNFHALNLPFNGDIFAIVAYNRALSDNEVTVIKNWAKAKYGVGEFIGKVVVDGDSITSGTSTSTYVDLYIQILAKRRPELWFTSFAVSGQTIENMNSDASTEIDAQYDPDLDHNICIIFAGTNDMTSVSGETAFSRLQTYCAARRAAGWKTIVVTCLPRGNLDATFDAKRLIFNQAIRDAGTSLCDVIVDLGADPYMGQIGSTANTTFFETDYIHPKNAAHTYMANYVYDGLSKLLAISGKKHV